MVLEPAQVHAREVFGVATLRGDYSHFLQKFARLIRAYPVVHLGQFLDELVAVAAREATRHDQFLFCLLAFDLRENRVDGFFLGGLDEPAGVYQNVVCLRCAVTSYKTGVQHLADQVFCIDLVLGAS